jgi:hypothetical protein
VVTARSALDDQRVDHARCGEDFFADAVSEERAEAPESATADLIEALEREIRDHESALLADPSEAAR